ncbi:MAG: nucleotidyltransferase domain-containing protein [Halanaerobiaceae bacterium]|jgi:predicted nucleotidyltransferase|nr:nucleotidyltransferase domain-containing protein [Halanaerobiaceae bacterium]
MDITRNCRNILKRHENIIFAYIFGSYVQGKVRTDSDIDIAIYLKDKMDIDDYLEIKMQLSEACKKEVDLIILNDSTPLLKYQIYKNHILLFTRDKSIESRFKVKTLFEYTDMKRYLDLSYNKTIERLKNEVNSDGECRGN